MVTAKLGWPMLIKQQALSSIKRLTGFVLVLLAACAPLTPAQTPANAQQAFEMVLRDYEQGSLQQLQAMLPSSFVGRDILLDAARKALTDQRNIRIELMDMQQQSTGNAQALSMRWEKRFIRASNGAVAVERGTLRTVLRQAGSAWQFENLPADNMFTR